MFTDRPEMYRRPVSTARLDSALMAVAVLVASLVLAVTPAPAVAQTLSGTVLDGATERPLPDATLVLLHPDGYPVGDTVGSGPDGRFSIDVPEPGPYYIQADLIGYTSIVDGILDFTSANGSLEINVYLLTKPVEIEGVDVEVDREQTRRHLRAAGFYQRASDSYGDFVTPEEIESRGGVADVSDLMRSIPNIITMQSLVLFRASGPAPKPAPDYARNPGAPGVTSSGGALIMMNDDGSYDTLDACEPLIWVDGSRMQKVSSNGQIRAGDFSQGLDAYVSAEDVAAIEVYSGIAGTPFEWGGADNQCGAIVIWTKQGR